MAVQLSHPQGAYVCGFCSFTSTDHRVLVEHLVEHTVFKEKKHEHILWCGLCKPLIDVNHMDVHQQATTNGHLNGRVYNGNNDLDYGDTSNYYSGYNGLYNPYAFPNTYYYPMNIAYGNPCYVNVYYQSQNTIFYTDDFYDGAHIFPTLSAPLFIEPAPENKHLLDAPHNSANVPNVDSCSTRSLTMTLSDFGVHSNDSNYVNYDSSIQTLPVYAQNFPENSPNKSRYKESSISKMGTFSTSIANEDLHVVQLNEFGTISNIEPQPVDNISTIQPGSDTTLLRKLNGSQVKKLSKAIPDHKCNTVKRNPLQTNVRKANDSKTVLKDITESSDLEFFKAGSTVVDAKFAIKKNSVNTINMNANIRAISVTNKNSFSKLPPMNMTESCEIDVNANANSTDKLLPVSFHEAAHTEKIVMNDASDVKNCSVEVLTRSKNVLRKESNSQIHTCERETSSENFLEKGSIPAEDMNVIPISDVESSPKVYSTVLLEDTSDAETGSINANGSWTEIDLNEIHSEHPTGKLETLPNIQNSISILSESDSLVSDAKLSPKVTIARENSVSDIHIQTVGMNADPRTKKDEVLGIVKRRDISQMQLKIGTREDALNLNSHRDSKDNSTESLKKCQNDETDALSNVEHILLNSRRSDLDYTNKNYRSVSARDQVRLTYSEVVKRGLHL